MLYVATGKFAYVIAGTVLFVIGSAGVYKISGHVRDRVDAWLHSYKHAGDTAYQLVQARYSIAHGGVGGTGLGHGTFTPPGSHTAYIPFLNTDFIFAALAQELGLIGAAGLLLVYMLFVARGFRIALLTDDGFSKLLAVGLTFAFALQAFIIVGGILGLIPLTGITMPFVSYGGSSVVANFVLLAGLMLVSNRANTVRGTA
jgi:cell division protein FtsW (lipid II flippase)